MSASGMSINGNKSIKLTLEKDGKNGRIILRSTPYEVNEVHTQPLDVDQQVEYLDVQFKWKGCLQQRSTGKLEATLVNTIEVRLKPHQSLDVQARFAFPKLYHEQVLGMAHRRTLTSMDVKVLARVCAWLCLATVICFLYFKRASGGLGPPSLSTSISLAQRNAWHDQSMNQYVWLPRLLSPTKRLDVPNSSIATSKDDAASDWSNDFVSSGDGLDLRGFPVNLASLLRLSGGNTVPLRLFLLAVWLRGGLLSAGVRPE
ncbi:hypothetical protein D915_004138 [Fasciola hepatica]|uniref:Uncharacterized protein n=1 Tax=Fasciola hepatica TaxID=6192 RepID=A0A4E0REI6_FASHE|nr:hypothetical protein D915_004138 [Fasciola hepatica]